MKVLTVVFSLHKGGTERAALNFATGYQRIGMDSRVLMTEPDQGPRVKEAREAGIITYSVLSADDLHEIARWGPELVHIHSHGLRESDVRKIYSVVSGKAKFFVETNVFSTPSEWEGLLDFSLQMSHWGQSLYLRRGGDPLKAAIIPYPVEPMVGSSLSVSAAKEKLGIDPSAWVIGRVGQNYPNKWSDWYLKVLPNLVAKEKAHFLAVNPPQNLATKLIKVLGPNVTVVESIVDDSVLADTYRAMDVFLHIANQGESFGFVLAEAGLFGIPVVTLSTPWGDNAQQELIVNGLNGFLVHRPTSISAALLATREKLWDTAKMRQSVLSRFGQDTVVESVIDISVSYRAQDNSQRSFELAQGFDRPPLGGLRGPSLFGTVRQILILRNACSLIRARLGRLSRKLHLLQTGSDL